MLMQMIYVWIKINNILVTEYFDDRVTIFSPTGKLIQEIPIIKPTALCIFNQKIIIGHDTGLTSIYSN